MPAATVPVSDRWYLATFDIEGAKGREADYKKTEDALKHRFRAQNYFRFVKQCCVIRLTRSSDNAVSIRDVIHQRLGSNCNIVVLRLGRGYAFKLLDATKRKKARVALGSITKG
jgi:hypothetical protein